MVMKHLETDPEADDCDAIRMSLARCISERWEPNGLRSHISFIGELYWLTGDEARQSLLVFEYRSMQAEVTGEQVSEVEFRGTYPTTPPLSCGLETHPDTVAIFSGRTR